MSAGSMLAGFRDGRLDLVPRCIIHIADGALARHRDHGLATTNYLNSISFNFDLENLPALDRTKFSTRALEAQ